MVKIFLVLILMQCTGKSIQTLNYKNKGSEELLDLLNDKENFKKSFSDWLDHEMRYDPDSRYNHTDISELFKLFKNYINSIESLKNEKKVTKKLEAKNKLIEELNYNLKKMKNEKSHIFDTLKIDQCLMFSYRIIVEKDEMIAQLQKLENEKKKNEASKPINNLKEKLAYYTIIIKNLKEIIEILKRSY